MGMFTFLGEGASTISGGQRQRLMIARAIASRPRILLFDEATSALDNRTQAIVSASLENLKATRIVIAHRLSTIINADRIYVLVAGRIVQSGTYAELRTIRLLAGGGPPPRMLEGCFRALSSDEWVFQVGLMLSRGEDAVRLCIRLRSVERIMEYLTLVGWPGDEADLRGVLEPLARSVDRVALAIDVGDAVRPKIGLECRFDGNRQPRREPRWGAFLDSESASGQEPLTGLECTNSNPTTIRSS
jgi:hypothetical protein